MKIKPRMLLLSDDVLSIALPFLIFTTALVFSWGFDRGSDAKAIARIVAIAVLVYMCVKIGIRIWRIIKNDF